MTKYTKAEQAKALELLRQCFPRGSTVYTILRHVSKSGMARDISIVALDPVATTHNGDLAAQRVDAWHPNWAAACILGERLTRGGTHDAVRVNGAGMDMGFELAYRLAYALHGDGYALKHQWL